MRCKKCQSINVVENGLCAECLQIEEKRGKLLEAAKNKPIREFVQYDAFIDVLADDVMRRDDDGDCLWKSTATELRNSDCVRVQIPVDTNPIDALRALEKIIKWVKKDVSWIKEGTKFLKGKLEM